MRRGKYEAVRKEFPSGNTAEEISFSQNVMMYLHDMVYLILIVMCILIFFLRIVVVAGSSMNDTLVDGDYLLLLSNTLYRNPEQGDIVVASKDSFRSGEPIIKRIIALEGQTVDIDFETGNVYVDGELLSEPYLGSPTKTPEGVSFPLTVDEGCLFVMGDNRMGSTDSRSPSIGQIDKREILGRAIFLIIPGNEEGDIDRDFTRIGGLA